MIALDTNLVVRLIVQDDPAQSRAVERLLIRARRDQQPLFIADVVLCELVWVLTRRYQQTRSRIAESEMLPPDVPTSALISITLALRLICPVPFIRMGLFT